MNDAKTGTDRDALAEVLIDRLCPLSHRGGWATSLVGSGGISATFDSGHYGPCSLHRSQADLLVAAVVAAGWHPPSINCFAIGASYAPPDVEPEPEFIYEDEL